MFWQTIKKAIGRTYNSCQLGALPIETRPTANVRLRFSLYTVASVAPLNVKTTLNVKTAKCENC